MKPGRASVATTAARTLHPTRFLVTESQGSTLICACSSMHPRQSNFYSRALITTRVLRKRNLAATQLEWCQVNSRRVSVLLNTTGKCRRRLRLYSKLADQQLSVGHGQQLTRPCARSQNSRVCCILLSLRTSIPLDLEQEKVSTDMRYLSSWWCRDRDVVVMSPGLTAASPTPRALEVVLGMPAHCSGILCRKALRVQTKEYMMYMYTVYR